MAGMMLKMAGISAPSIPTPGGDKDDGDGMTREEKIEAQKQKTEELARAERKRANKYKQERAVRDLARDDIRDKYKIEKKPQDDEEEEEEDEDDGFGSNKGAPPDDDPVAKAKAMAEEKLKGAKQMMSGMKFW
jgi:hypothetical protein